MASQKTCKTVDIEEVVKKALEDLKKNKLILQYGRHEQTITEVLRKAAQTEAKLTTKMFDMIPTSTMWDIEQAMTEIIGEQRVAFIKKSFAIETYRMTVVQQHGDQSSVHVLRKGVPFQPKRMLVSFKDIVDSIWFQWASLVIELFIFVFSCVGIHVDITEAELRTMARELEVIVQKPAFQRALDTFLKTWTEAEGSTYKKAKAIFFLLNDTYSLGFFWTIAGMIFTNMSTLEMMTAIAEITLMIIAAFATDGFALIARILLALESAIYLAEKIANIVKFYDMKR